jgi:hypothetical protein
MRTIKSSQSSSLRPEETAKSSWVVPATTFQLREELRAVCQIKEAMETPDAARGTSCSAKEPAASCGSAQRFSRTSLSSSIDLYAIFVGLRCKQFHARKKGWGQLAGLN